MFTYKLVSHKGNEIGTLNSSFEWHVTQSCSIEGVNIYRGDNECEFIPLARTCQVNNGDTFTVTFDHTTALKDLKYHLDQIESYKSVRQILDYFEFTLTLMNRIQNDEPKT